jgi:gluconolactonase
MLAEGRVTRRATGFAFVEGPVWHVDRRVLIFSDITGDRMYALDPRTDRVTVYRDPSNRANGNVFDRDHRLITCEHATSRVVREEQDGSISVVANAFNGVELNSPNDAVVDAQGRIIFTDPPYGRDETRPQRLAVQGVYRVDPRDGSIVCLADDFDRPNGLCFAEEERVLYVNDSARMHIRRFEVRNDGLAGGQVWATVYGAGPGAPDGMKVDSAGSVLCCGPGGIHTFDRNGKSVGLIPVPEEVANLNWGDDDLATLYMTATSSIYSCRVRTPGPELW